MATTNYYSMGGRLIGESTGGVMRNYMTDALGSVVGTVVNGAVENTYQYKPYGGLLAKTGTAPDPSFLWNGGSGYRATHSDFNEYYVRHRHYCSSSPIWTAVDYFWPLVHPYGYVLQNPTRLVDPSGRLHASVLTGPTNLGPCGSACVEIVWKVDGPDEQYGYIIQHITNDATVKDCHGTLIANGTSCPDYWEAWVVTAGKVTGVDKNGNSVSPKPGSGDDIFGLPDWGNCTKGTRTKSGVAKFSKSLPSVFELPEHPGASPCSGSLWSTLTYAAWTDSGGLSRVLETNWACCCATANPQKCRGAYRANTCTYKGAKCDDGGDPCTSKDWY